MLIDDALKQTPAHYLFSPAAVVMSAALPPTWQRMENKGRCGVGECVLGLGALLSGQTIGMIDRKKERCQLLINNLYFVLQYSTCRM